MLNKLTNGGNGHARAEPDELKEEWEKNKQQTMAQHVYCRLKLFPPLLLWSSR